MKKKYLIVIVFAISQIALAGNRIPKQNWQIRTKDSRLTVGISNNRPVIYELKK